MAKFVYRPGERLRAVMTILRDNVDGLKIKDVIERLPQVLELNDYEKGNFKSGIPRLEHVIRFNVINAIKIGWILKDDKNWIITDAGLKALNRYGTGEQIYKNIRLLYKQFKNKKNCSKMNPMMKN